jgi:septum formation protein
VILVLASQSTGRRRLLQAAGIEHDADMHDLDEEAAKARLVAQGVPASALAQALAEQKAVGVSARRPGELVLGCDQTLSLDDGTRFDKAGSLRELRQQLLSLSGHTHSLFSAMAIAEGGRTVWRHLSVSRLTMRTLSPDFIDAYLDAEGEALLGCVGGYRVEGRGVQLFERIEGSHYAIIGLPLIPLLDYLRQRGLLAS